MELSSSIRKDEWIVEDVLHLLEAEVIFNELGADDALNLQHLSICTILGPVWNVVTSGRHVVDKVDPGS